MRPPGVSLEGLCQLHRAHLFTVPFENLDIHRGVRIRLDEVEILHKIVRAHRGGFCYELNGCFAWLLEELGFSVQRWSAQVWSKGRWGIAFDHMVLAVDLDGMQLVDVGFGDSFLEPLQLEADVEQVRPEGTFRLNRDGVYWVLERCRDPEVGPQLQFRFTEEPHTLGQFRPGCDFHQSPASHFAEATVCSLARPDGRWTLRDDRLIETGVKGRTESPLEGPEAWLEVLRSRFGVKLESLPRPKRPTSADG